VLKNLKFPLLYVAEVLLFIPWLAGLVGTSAFLSAKPLDTLDLHSKSLPSNWEAAVPNHGKFLPGYLIANHPIIFVSVVLLQLGSVAILYRVYKALESQRKESSVSAVAHKIAQGSVIAVWMVMIYSLVMHLLVGEYPA